MEHIYQASNTIDNPPRPRLGFWQKLGGTSLMIAVSVHLIVLVAGAVWIFQVVHEQPNKDPFIPLPKGGGEPGARTTMRQKSLRRITPSSNVRSVTTTDPNATISIPESSGVFGQMAALKSLSDGSLGNGGTGGTGGGPTNLNGAGNFMGNADVRMFKPIPLDMSKRCSKADRLQRIKENNGSPACEDAVLAGLRWLKANQKSDGSFADGNYKVAMTGLALLAYFGHCETPASDEFGDSCNSGIVFLVNLGLKNDGRLATQFSGNGWCYEHAIATYALAEAYTFCKQLKASGLEIPNLKEITEKAGQFIIDNQNDNGGWAYAYAMEGGHTDVSVVGWQIQALKACSHTGIQFRGMTSTINKGLKYVNASQDKSGGFGYTSTAASGGLGYHTLTGVGMLCNQMWGKGRSEVSKAARYVLQNTRFEYNAEFCDLYGHYYESQAMMQRGGRDWQEYNQLFRDQLLHNQDNDGSWKVPGGGKTVRAVAPQFVGDKVYRTCLCTLMLEVYYRFLSTDGNKGRERPSI